MVKYSLSLGIWKSLKNTLVVLLPAGIAGWAAFSANVPAEYQPIVTFFGGLLAYLVKNYIQVTNEEKK